MKIELKANQIKAVLECAGKQDIRYYLNGALIEKTYSGQVFLVSTDGTKLFCGLVDTIKEGKPERVIIERESLELALKSKIKEFILDTENKTIGPLTYKEIDGNFPNWRSVVPDPLSFKDPKPAQFDPSLVLSCAKALTLWDNAKDIQADINHRGEQSALMTRGSHTGAFCVIMPYRSDPSVNYGFQISDYEKPQVKELKEEVKEEFSQEEKPKKINLIYYTDPGHGWLKIELSILEKIGIKDKITNYSYKKDDFAYLEEDCDLPKALEALKENGLEYDIQDVYQEYTPIRNYRSFNA